MEALVLEGDFRLDGDLGQSDMGDFGPGGDLGKEMVWGIWD